MYLSKRIYKACFEHDTVYGVFKGINKGRSISKLLLDKAFNPIQDGGGGGRGQKDPPTSFSPVTSKNVGFGTQNFLTFSFNPFATLVQNFKFVPSASPKLLNLNQDHPSKKAIFLVKSL